MLHSDPLDNFNGCTSPSTRRPSTISAQQWRKGGATAKPPEQVMEVRRRHGYQPRQDAPESGTTLRAWREQVLSGQLAIDGVVVPPRVQGEWPKNRPILQVLERKFGFLGFSWTVGQRQDTVRDRQSGTSTTITRRWVNLLNAPTIGGYTPDLATLLLVDPQAVDGYEQAMSVSSFCDQVGRPSGPQVEQVRSRMNQTGVGYKGFQGVSWRQALTPFVLPASFLDKLGDLARALMLGLETVHGLYHQDPALQLLLNAGRPARIPAIVDPGRVGLMRPDIVIVRDPQTGELRPVITELESCPGGQGMAHAMEVGYELPPTMVESYLRLLRGRRLLIFATNEWAEYVWEQACFAAALRKRGVDAQVWFDKPLRDIHARVQADWKPHAQISPEARAGWNTDFLGRLRTQGFDAFVHGSDDGIPDVLGPHTVVYRFGYFDNFINTGALELMRRWQAQGAQVMNPLWFFLESKALLTAFWHPSVVDRLTQVDPQALAILHNGVAQTHPIGHFPGSVTAVRGEWLTKIAAWDGNNRSWGARGVEFGSQAQSERTWIEHLETCAQAPYPIVLQRFILSDRPDVAYRDVNGNIAVDRGTRTRLTPFFLFHKDSVDLAGSTITLRSGSLRIHGADDATEGPAVYRTED